MTCPEVPRIRVLPADLVNQIAAGEVVERPASAVKELVENALDAEASRVEIALRGSGIEEILVRDDGHGMSRQEAALALVRHATSKLACEADLRRIATFGFRGEALPAIAAVSRLRLLTRRAVDDEGTEVLAEGPGDPIVRPAGAPPGTTVVVRDLFYRTPARRKFLKSPRTELATCLRVAEWLALSNPSVGFTFQHDGRMLRRFLPCASAGDRVREVFPDLPFIEIEGSLEGVLVLAFLAGPEHARPGGRHLELLVNGRRVSDRSVFAAVASAYETMLPPGTLPPGVVYVNLDPAAVDVNVHPRKEEVRFVNPRQVYAAVRHILRDGLARTRTVASAGGVWSAQPFVTPVAEPTADPGGVGGIGGSGPQPVLPVAEPRPWRPPVPEPLGPRTFALFSPPAPVEQLPVMRGSSASLSGAPSPEQLVAEPAGRGRPTPATSVSFASLVPAGQLFLTYLVCEGEDRVVLIDQHAAHERVVFEDLRAALRSGAVPSQSLISPLPVPLGADLLAVVEEEGEVLLTLGFDAEPFGPDRALLRAHPAALRGDPVEAFRETVAVLAHGRGGEHAMLERGLATVACHCAIRAGKRVSDAEVLALLGRMDEVDFGVYCPHGRPAWAVITRSELERMFGRR